MAEPRLSRRSHFVALRFRRCTCVRYMAINTQSGMRTNGNFSRGAVVVPAVWFKAHPGAARCQERDVQRAGTSVLFPDRGLGGLFREEILALACDVHRNLPCSNPTYPGAIVSSALLR